MDNPKYPTRKFLNARSRVRNRVPPTFLHSRQISHEPEDDDVSYRNPCKRQKFNYQEVSRPEPTVENVPATIPSLKCTIGKKSSANARLVTYRNILNNTKNERVKVHTLEVIKQVGETPTTSHQFEGISRLENSVSPNRTIESQGSSAQIDPKQFENVDKGSNAVNLKRSHSVQESSNAVNLKRSHSVQDRLKKYKLPRNGSCDRTVQNNNNSYKAIIDRASKTKDNPETTVEYINKIVEYPKETLDYTLKTKHNTRDTYEHINTAKIMKTVDCHNTNTDSSEETFDYPNKAIDNPKKIINNTSTTIPNPYKTKGYTNKTFFDTKKHPSIKTIERPSKTTEYANNSTSNPKKTIDYSNDPTYNSNKTSDYTNNPTYNPKKTINYSNDPTYNSNKTSDYTNNPTFNPKKTIGYPNDQTYNCNKTTDYTNDLTLNSKKSIDYTNDSTYNPNSTHYTNDPPYNPNKTIDYHNKTTDIPNETTGYFFDAANYDKTIDYTALTTDTSNKTTDHSFEATTAANSNKSVDHTSRTTETVTKSIDYSYRATEKMFVPWLPHSNNSAETSTNEENDPFALKRQSRTNVQNVENPFVNTSFGGDIFGKRSTDNASDLYEEEEMDWSPVEDSFVLENIDTMRQDFDQVMRYQTPFKQSVTKNLEELPKNDSVFKDIYIVIDTNIFLSHLSLVRELMELKLNGVVEPIILVPWFVIQELDYMKDGRSGAKQLQRNAQHAVRFIHENLVAKRKNFKGQTVMDAMNNKLNSASPDDGILACCMQVQDRGNTAFLLTNDKNLCNKAMINEVQAFTHDKIMSTLRPSQVSPEAKSRLATLANKGERIRQLVGHLFSYVILERTSKEFGPTLSKVALMKNPPWTLPDCLYRFEKLWISVFSGNLSKYFLKAVQDFKKFVSTHRKFDNEDVLKKFVEHSLTCCVYLKNAWEGHFSQTVSECIGSITSVMDDEQL